MFVLLCVCGFVCFCAGVSVLGGGVSVLVCVCILVLVRVCILVLVRVRALGRL